MVDTFKNNVEGLSSPVDNGYDVVPDDNTSLPFKPRCLHCNQDGNIALEWSDGTTSVLRVFAGVDYWYRPEKVLATGTTAQVVALY